VFSDVAGKGIGFGIVPALDNRNSARFDLPKGR
jgi:hypothetical protein